MRTQCVHGKRPAGNSLSSTPSTRSHPDGAFASWTLFFVFLKVCMMYITLNIFIIVVQSRGIKSIHVAVQSSPPSISRTLSSSQTEMLSPLNTNSPSPAPSPSPGSWQPWLYCICLCEFDYSRSLILEASYKICSLCLASHDTFKLHPFCSTCQNFLTLAFSIC